MAKIWLPGDSDFAIAMREPNLLIPNRKPDSLQGLELRDGKFKPTNLWVWGNDANPKTVAGSVDITIQRSAPVASIAGNHGLAVKENQTGWNIDGYAFSAEVSTGYYNFSIPEKTPSEVTWVLHAKTIVSGGYNANPFSRRNSGYWGLPFGGESSGTDLRTIDDYIYIIVLKGGTTASCWYYLNGELDYQNIGYTPLYDTGQQYFCGESSNGFGGWSIPMYSFGIFYNKAFTAAEAKEFSSNLYGNLFRASNDAPYPISVPASGAAPVLSSPNAINVQSDRATPQVTLTF